MLPGHVKYIKVRRLAKYLGLDPYIVRNLMIELEEENVVEPFIVSRDGRGRTRYKIYVVKDEEEFKETISKLRRNKNVFV